MFEKRAEQNGLTILNDKTTKLCIALTVATSKYKPGN